MRFRSTGGACRLDSLDLANSPPILANRLFSQFGRRSGAIIEAARKASEYRARRRESIAALFEAAGQRLWEMELEERRIA